MSVPYTVAAEPRLAEAYDLGFRAFGRGEPQRYSNKVPGSGRIEKLQWLKAWLRGWRQARAAGKEPK